MPTTSARAAWWPMAFECWTWQTWQGARLLIGCDGRPPAEIPANASLVDPKHWADAKTLGGKYSALYSLAADCGAEWIGLWSDDDWQGPTSIERRIVESMRLGARRVGYRSFRYADLRSGQCYRLQDIGPKNWTLHLSLIIHRSVWIESDPYPDDRPHSSDTAWQRSIQDIPALVIPEGDMVCLKHGANTWSRLPEAWEQWRVPDYLGDWIGEDMMAQYEEADLCGSR